MQLSARRSKACPYVRSNGIHSPGARVPEKQRARFSGQHSGGYCFFTVKSRGPLTDIGDPEPVVDAPVELLNANTYTWPLALLIAATDPPDGLNITRLKFVPAANGDSLTSVTEFELT
jgi:hypothetical protein